MLDFTHVLAGPRSARTLAEYGAEVLHISSPWFADTLAQHLGVDAGKYDAYLDLRYGKDMVTMRHLAATADVFASTYRPAVNKRFGLLSDQLAAASERGIVYMSATAYGHSGPWKDRPGFDQNGQVASGFVMAEGQGGAPRFSPAPLDSYTLRLLTRQNGLCPLCGDHLLSADQPPNSPEQWERWWLHVTRKAIAASYPAHHGRPGPAADDRTRLLHASCQRGLQARQRRNPAAQPATPSRLA